MQKLEENIEISEKINESLVMEEDHEIKIVAENDENPIIEKDLEINIVQTIKEEIEDKIVKDIEEIKLDQCKSQAPIILMGSTKPKFIDFIGVEGFDSIFGKVQTIFLVMWCMQWERAIIFGFGMILGVALLL